MYKFRSNTFSKSQIPSLIPGHEEKCSVVIGCCRFAASMQHIYLQNSILRASTVSQTLAALVLAIAPKEQSNGMCAVICRSESSCLQHRGAWRPTTHSRQAKPVQLTFVWTSPEFQPLESGDFVAVLQIPQRVVHILFKTE